MIDLLVPYPDLFIKIKPSEVAEQVNTLPTTDSHVMSFITWAELLRASVGSSRN